MKEIFRFRFYFTNVFWIV